MNNNFSNQKDKNNYKSNSKNTPSCYKNKKKKKN